MLGLPVLLTVYDEADGKHIEDTFERHLLFLHLLVDGEGCLRPYFQLVLYAFIQKFLLEGLDELHHQFLSVSLCTFELVGDGPVLFRVGISEIYVLHFTLDIVQSQLVGKRYVQHHGLKDFPFPGQFREHVEGTHDFKPVCNLQHGHTRIL